MKAGEIGFTSAVFDNLKNREGFHATLVGKRTLKNVADPVGLYLFANGSTSTSETV